MDETEFQPFKETMIERFKALLSKDTKKLCKIQIMDKLLELLFNDDLQEVTIDTLECISESKYTTTKGLTESSNFGKTYLMKKLSKIIKFHEKYE